MPTEPPLLRAPAELPFLEALSWYDRGWRRLSPLDMLRRYQSGWRNLGVVGEPSGEELEFVRELARHVS